MLQAYICPSVFLFLPIKYTIMANDKPQKYLLAIEWDNPFADRNNKGLVLYDISPKEGMTPEELEKFIKEKAFPAIDGILTRAIRFKAKYLLIDEKDGPIDPLDNLQISDLINENLAGYKVVGSYFNLTDTQ